MRRSRVEMFTDVGKDIVVVGDGDGGSGGGAYTGR